MGKFFLLAIALAAVYAEPESKPYYGGVLGGYGYGGYGHYLGKRSAEADSYYGEFSEDTDMAAMVITLARDLPKLTVTTEEFLEDTDMVVMVITLERDLLIATMEEFLEDTDMVDMSTENRCN